MDEPSAHEAAADEAGTVTLADRARTAFEAVGLGDLSPGDASRVEAIEMAEEEDDDLDELREALGESVLALRDYVDACQRRAVGAP